MKIVLISSKKQFVPEIDAVFVPANLMEAVHVELLKRDGYLPDKGLEFAVPEYFREYVLAEEILFVEYKLRPVLAPPGDVGIFLY